MGGTALNIVKLAELFSTIIKYKVYAINFPDYTEGTFVKIEIVSGVVEHGGVYDFNIQFMVKANHPAESERLALDILSKVDVLTNKEFNAGAYQLILAKASSPQPYFVGATENGEFIFSIDFRVLTTKI